MWNDLRGQEESSDYNFGSESDDIPLEKPAPQSDGMFKEPILGMSAPQRLVVALFLLADVCILGFLLLIVLDKIHIG
jgi:hypothetical protein